MPANDPTLCPVSSTETIQPPPFRRQAGRPKKLRRKSHDEPINPYKLKRKYGEVRCSKCNLTGHNMRSCKGVPVKMRAKRKKQGNDTQEKPMGRGAGRGRGAQARTAQVRATRKRQASWPGASELPIGAGRGYGISVGRGSGAGRGVGIGAAVGRGTSTEGAASKGRGAGTGRAASKGRGAATGRGAGRGDSGQFRPPSRGPSIGSVGTSSSPPHVQRLYAAVGLDINKRDRLQEKFEMVMRDIPPPDL